MHQILTIVGDLALALALAGSAYLVLAGVKLRAFFGQASPPSPDRWPSITVLKPLHGDEPGLEAALESLFAQCYPGEVQLVFGIQDPNDRALAVVERLRRAHMEADVAVVVDARAHGSNRKMSNVINMAERARHETIVLADSDIFVRPDYLRGVAAALAEPQTGVVTCPYSGRPLAGLWSQLAAMQVTYQFLPNVVTGVSLGLAQPCMGSTIALRREVLDRIGGFAPFADLLADDYAIGEAVRAAGCRSAVLPVLVEHGCAERTLGELVAHELRWARTIRGIDPGGFFGSVVTHAFVWALVGVVLTAATPVSLVVLAIALAARLWMMRQAAIVTQPKHQPWWLAPVRDILSFAVFLGSFFVRTVEWRGNRFRVDPEGGLSRA